MNVALLRNELNAELNKLPQVSGNGGDVQISRQLLNLLNLCDKLAQQKQDKFISSELFLLAALEERGALNDILKKMWCEKRTNFTSDSTYSRRAKRERSKCRREQTSS